MKILDHGYLKLILSYGSDEEVIRDARMSTDKGFLGWEPSCPNPAHDAHCTHPDCHRGDKHLLKYLYTHRHMTPFEGSGLKFEIKAPIMVFREWHRHRTQCLAGDTKICCVTPNGTTFQRTIKEIFQLKHGEIVDSVPRRHRNGKNRKGEQAYTKAQRKNEWRTRILPNCQNRLLRVYNENTGEFEIAPMSSVWESGVKTIYALETMGGHLIKASAEHPFLTKRGWVKLKDLEIGDELAKMGKVAAQDRPIPPSLRQGIGVWTSMMRPRLINPKDNCYLCGEEFAHLDLELDHVVPVYENLKLALDENNLRPACARCHRVKTNTEQPSKKDKTKRGVRWEIINKLPIRIGEEMTYDIEVSGNNHNYVANGLVVHNSYNEMSGRYIEIPNEHYVPSIERLMDGAKSGILTKNKQQAGTNTMRLEDITEAWARKMQHSIIKTQRIAQNNYSGLLECGVPKELARINMPVSRYSRMRATANLRNWIAFLTLREDPSAQWEIRQYAHAISDVIKKHFPRTWELYLNGK